MDSLPKKRKLVECGANLASPDKRSSFTKTFNLSEEKKHHASVKILKKSRQNILNVQQEKCFLNKNVNVKSWEINITSTEIRSERENSISEETSLANISLSSQEIALCPPDYIEDIIAHEMFKESLYSLSLKFCKEFDINPTGREILVDWLISVQVYLKADESILHLAVALLDIVLDSVPTPLNELQAAAVAAFWVAYKFIHGNIGVKTLLNLCAGSVTKLMVVENEILVLQKSRLIQAGGSLSIFFNYFLYKFFGLNYPLEVYYCGMFFIEVMLLKFIFVNYRTYERAVTAIFASMNAFEYSHKFEAFDVSRFITKRKLQLYYRQLIQSLRVMYQDEETLKRSSVYKKYKSSKCKKISIHQNLYNLLSIA